MDTIQRPQQTVKSGENPDVAFHVVQLLIRKYMRRHRLVLNTVIAQNRGCPFLIQIQDLILLSCFFGNLRTAFQ